MFTDAQRRELETWAAEVTPRAYAYALSLTRDATRAEDVVQECLFRLLRRAGDYDLLRDGVRLLFRAVSNLCINEATRRRTVASIDAGDEGGGAVADRRAPSPADEASAAELRRAIDVAMDALPPMQRAALELRALGQGKAEIAEILGVSESNAGVLVFRARTALAERLRPWTSAGE